MPTVFNPHPKIDAVSIDGEHACWVIDDALTDPLQLIDYALAHRADFSMAPFNTYPGLEFHLPSEMSALQDDFFRAHIRRLLGARRTLQMYSRLSLVTLPPEKLSPIQWLCHRDRMGVPHDQCVAASVLYLFTDEDLGGTSFFKPRKPTEETEALMRLAADSSAEAFTAETGITRGYLLDSNEYFERVCTVPARWNRMIFYDGSLFHSPDIRAPEKLNEDFTKGRLTLNGFFTCRRAAS